MLFERCKKLEEAVFATDKWMLSILISRRRSTQSPHDILLLKAKSYGIQGDVLEWLRALLIWRKQRVSVNGQVSGWSHVSSGIPPGSVLGPMMFVIYINDLPSSVQHAFVRILLTIASSRNTKRFLRMQCMMRYKVM